MKSVFKDLITIVPVGAIWSFRSAARIIDPECPPQRALETGVGPWHVLIHRPPGLGHPSNSPPTHARSQAVCLPDLAWPYEQRSRVWKPGVYGTQRS